MSSELKPLMKCRIFTALLLLMFAATALNSADRADAITQEEYRVFAAAAEFIMSDSSWKDISAEYFLLNKMTEKCRLGKSSDKEFIYISRNIKDVTWEIYSDYMQKNDKKYLIEKKIPMRSKYELLNNKPESRGSSDPENKSHGKLKNNASVELGDSLSAGPKLTDIKSDHFEVEKLKPENMNENSVVTVIDFWKEFYKKHPGASGIAVFSRCGFSKDGNIALIYVLNQFDGLGGKGSFLLMKKTAGKWKVTAESVMYIS